MAEGSICRKCFHSYVCEQFNEHKDDNNKKCHFFSDHFVSTADVVEVKHGKWTIKRDEYDCEYMVCSCCGECFYDGDNDTVDRTPKYCSECGAIMDGRSENNADR